MEKSGLHASLDQSSLKQDTIRSEQKAKFKIKWVNVILISWFHLVAVYSVIFHALDLKLLTLLWGFLIGWLGGFGVTGGAHRLWAHRSYKASLPLRLILLICFTIAGQNTVYDWVRDHRVHHRYSETDADPHNAKRGFFFSHVGWLMVHKHPLVIEKGSKVDMSDIVDDPLLDFQRRHFVLLKIVLCFLLPVMVPPLVWGESWWLSILALAFVRYTIGLNCTWLVNSAAHIWGYRPYDKNIGAAENGCVAALCLGEGWHNYHHVLPWDYKASELPDHFSNITTALIDAFAAIGWVTDRRTASPQLIASVTSRRGSPNTPPSKTPS